MELNISVHRDFHIEVSLIFCNLFGIGPKIKSYTEKRLSNYISFVHKWGGAFIVIAALFPFTPFSMVVIALSLLKYPYKWFLLLAMSRLARFVIQGILFFEVLNMDAWSF